MNKKTEQKTNFCKHCEHYDYKWIDEENSNYKKRTDIRECGEESISSDFEENSGDKNFNDYHDCYSDCNKFKYMRDSYGLNLLESLGLPTEKVLSATINIAPGDAVIATVKTFVNGSDVDKTKDRMPTTHRFALMNRFGDVRMDEKNLDWIDNQTIESLIKYRNYSEEDAILWMEKYGNEQEKRSVMYFTNRSEHRIEK